MVGGPEVNKFEQLSSLGHQMSLQEGATGSLYGGRGSLYGEVQWIMGNGHMGPPFEQTNMTETLPSCNFISD